MASSLVPSTDESQTSTLPHVQDYISLRIDTTLACFVIKRVTLSKVLVYAMKNQIIGRICSSPFIVYKPSCFVYHQHTKDLHEGIIVGVKL